MKTNIRFFGSLVAMMAVLAGAATAQATVVLEGESLIGTAQKTAGAVSIQAMNPLKWSHGAQLLWAVPAASPERLNLRFRCVKPGKYYLVGYFTRGPLYGNFRTSFNGQARPGIFSGEANMVQPSGAVKFGVVEVKEGVNTIDLVTLRPHCNTRRQLVGVDRFVLRHVASGPTLVNATKLNEALQETPKKPWLDPGPKKPGALKMREL